MCAHWRPQNLGTDNTIFAGDGTDRDVLAQVCREIGHHKTPTPMNKTTNLLFGLLKIPRGSYLGGGVLFGFLLEKNSAKKKRSHGTVKREAQKKRFLAINKKSLKNVKFNTCKMSKYKKKKSTKHPFWGILTI